MFGKRLKEMRCYRNMTQDQLAKASGVSRVMISDIENGKRKRVSAMNIAKIANALNVPVDYFFIVSVQ